MCSLHIFFVLIYRMLDTHAHSESHGPSHCKDMCLCCLCIFWSACTELERACVCARARMRMRVYLCILRYAFARVHARTCVLAYSASPFFTQVTRCAPLHSLHLRCPHDSFDVWQIAEDDLVVNCKASEIFTSSHTSKVVITEKLDGGNCCIFQGKVYARTHAKEATASWFSAAERKAAEIQVCMHSNYPHSLMGMYRVVLDGLFLK